MGVYKTPAIIYIAIIMNNNVVFSSLKKSFFLLWLSHLFMDFFTGIWPIYKTLAQIDITKAGIIAGVSGFLGEILQLAFGYFSDRGHRKIVLMVGLLFSSAIIWITFVSGIFNSFLILLLLMIGSGAFHPAAVGITGILSRQHKGRGILFFASGGAIGFGISQVAFTKLLANFHGHALIILLPVAGLLIALAFHRFPRQDAVKPTLSLKGFFQPILHCKRPLLLLYLAQMSYQLLVSALMFLMPDLLYARSCHSWLCLGGGHLCYVLGSALTMVPAGYLSDRYGQKSVLLVILSLASVLFYFFLSQRNLSLEWSMALLSILGAFLGIINPIIISWGNRLVPESPSTVSAILMGFAWCVGNLGALIAGLVAPLFKTDPIVNTISIMGLLLAVIFTLISMMPRPQPLSIPDDPLPIPVSDKGGE